MKNWLRGQFILTTSWLGDLLIGLLRPLSPPFLFLIRYAVALVIFLWVMVMFGVLNSTRVHGKRLLRHTQGRVLYVPRHLSMIDAYMYGVFFLFPRAFWNPSILPWFMADAANYKGNLFQRVFASCCRIIPIRLNEKGERSDTEALKTAIRKLEAGESVCIFPENGREWPEPDGRREFRAFADGVASLAQHADTVVVLAAEGTEDVQHYYKSWRDQPRIWFDWIGQRILWLLWCEGRKQYVDIAAAPIITAEEIQRIVSDTPRKKARRRITDYLMQVMMAKTAYLRSCRIRTRRMNKVQRQ